MVKVLHIATDSRTERLNIHALCMDRYVDPSQEDLITGERDYTMFTLSTLLDVEILFLLCLMLSFRISILLAITKAHESHAHLLWISYLEMLMHLNYKYY